MTAPDDDYPDTYRGRLDRGGDALVTFLNEQLEQRGATLRDLRGRFAADPNSPTDDDLPPTAA